MLNVNELIGFGAGGDLKNELIGMTEYSVPSFVSPCGSGVYTPVFNLPDWISPELLYAGKSFTVITKLRSCTAWNQYPVLTANLTYGSSTYVQSPAIAGKQWYMRIIYTSPNTIQGYGFYSGSSTNYPTGGLYISDVIFPL